MSDDAVPADAEPDGDEAEAAGEEFHEMLTALAHSAGEATADVLARYVEAIKSQAAYGEGFSAEAKTMAIGTADAVLTAVETLRGQLPELVERVVWEFVAARFGDGGEETPEE